MTIPILKYPSTIWSPLASTQISTNYRYYRTLPQNFHTSSTARIVDIRKIITTPNSQLPTPNSPTTPHDTTTSKIQTEETNNIQQHKLHTDINTYPSTILNQQIKKNMKHIHTTIVNTYPKTTENATRSQASYITPKQHSPEQPVVHSPNSE